MQLLVDIITHMPVLFQELGYGEVREDITSAAGKQCVEVCTSWQCGRRKVSVVVFSR
jgi:hypothetical protein